MMKFKGTYPRDIAAIATVFIVLILFVAGFNLYISFQFRNEFANYDRNNIMAIANMCRGYWNRGFRNQDLDFLLMNLARSFNLDHLIITDTLGECIYDSRRRLNVPFEFGNLDHLDRFGQLPGPQQIAQDGEAFLFHSADPPLYIYVSLAPAYSVVFGDIFRWHIFYVTISLVFTSFLGFFLLRNLLLPMRYVSSLAQDFGIEMKKEDFVSATFSEVYKKLRLREQMLVEFSSYIAHEFRNSLGAIIGLVRLVEKGKKHGADIIKECRRMENLIARILEYSKPLKLNLSDVDLNEVLAEALTRSSIPRRIQVSQKTTSDIPLIRGDHELLTAAVANLLKNAKEAIRNKGLIEVETGRANGAAYVVVRDSGTGMDSQEVDMIFNPFFSRKADGMGLGLAYVKKIVEQHEGRIEVISRKGKGSTFTLRFPATHK
jgi:signal transduction histidine kinase